MSGEKRRENLLKILQDSDVPVSGTKLAEKFEVTDNRFIYFDNYYMFSIVIDDDFNAIPSELIKK